MMTMIMVNIERVIEASKAQALQSWKGQ